jgi:hypothetical protein
MMPPPCDGLSVKKYLQSPEYLAFREYLDAKIWDLRVEFNSAVLKHEDPSPVAMMTPSLDEDFWLMRVPLTDHQALVVFPKLGSMGCGYQLEEGGWNVNLPLDGNRDFERHVKLVQHIDVNRIRPCETDWIPQLIVLAAVGMLDELVGRNRDFPDEALPQLQRRVRCAETEVVDVE